MLSDPRKVHGMNYFEKKPTKTLLRGRCLWIPTAGPDLFLFLFLFSLSLTFSYSFFSVALLPLFPPPFALPSFPLFHFSQSLSRAHPSVSHHLYFPLKPFLSSRHIFPFLPPSPRLPPSYFIYLHLSLSLSVLAVLHLSALCFLFSWFVCLSVCLIVSVFDCPSVSVFLSVLLHIFFFVSSPFSSFYPLLYFPSPSLS